MENKQFKRYYLFACIGLIVASFYPLYMGVKVIGDMLADGTVIKENYPKYIIPYTPICIALLTGLLTLPLCMKLFKRFALFGGSAISIGTFFLAELLFERKVVVTAAETVTILENWQMFMCYVPPEGLGEAVTAYKTQTPVDILIGNYNPAFKLHFYLISIVLILSVLNCLYGFGQMIKTGNKKRLKTLILQSVSSIVFLGLCILACFTAFWRDGNIRVSPLSAILMSVYFILLGVTIGIYVGSFLLGMRKRISVVVPAAVSAGTTILMYIGEMILLHGHLYSFGTGFFFKSIPGIIVAPVDILVILVSGLITALLFGNMNRKNARREQKSET